MTAPRLSRAQAEALSAIASNGYYPIGRRMADTLAAKGLVEVETAGTLGVPRLYLSAAGVALLGVA